jgi:steroid 5-alpha reductase family enzyme
MEHTFEIMLINLAAVAVMMFCGWIYSLIKNNVTIADSLWGLGFILTAWITFFLSDGFITRKIILTALVTLWGLRLFIHITKRNRGKGEDPRYTEWRKEYGSGFKYISLFKVFLVQALFLWIISLSIQAGGLSESPDYLMIFDFIGLAVWISGFLIESFADYKISSFMKKPENRGRVMNSKLWRYSRHPNYFGESAMWWGIFIISLSVPYGYITIISPIVITYTLLRITGVTLMEKTIFGNNLEYKEYVATTSSFIPWFKKKIE